ncbi:C-type lectin domain family 4 member E [Channa argus]|uniref:C-type lectin domain family 4 member E n=1 Tax=Channa argus TaxID=215402 RepID=A0A6G1QG16_CHAAH|nr:C-type lectin domain family 4 member E [Channa argus]KAK2891727.1 hypothetical protein Q8A73_017392 [Channa argus]
MISNDYSTDGASLYRSTRSIGSTDMVKVGSRRFSLYTLVIACLGLLNIVLLITAVAIGIYCGIVSEESTPHQITAQTLFIEVKQLQTLKSEVIKAHEEAKQALQKETRSHQLLKVQLEQNKTLSDTLQGQLEKLLGMRTTLMSNTSDIRESCGQCLSGWVLINSTCYFHAKSSPETLKSWADSKADCISRGARLVVIDNWEEQLNIFENLPKTDSNVRPWWRRTGSIWIGLTDAETEGTWVWVNNVTLGDGRYWIQGEPNNHGDNENCGAFLKIDDPRKSWFDSNCQDKKEWLCEMQPN